jgi:hypothetical protein
VVTGVVPQAVGNRSRASSRQIDRRRLAKRGIKRVVARALPSARKWRGPFMWVKPWTGHQPSHLERIAARVVVLLVPLDRPAKVTLDGHGQIDDPRHGAPCATSCPS